MKFLFVVDHLGPGGAQRQVVRQASLLAEAGHDVRIYTYLRLSSPYRLNPGVTWVADDIAGAVFRNGRRMLGIRREVGRFRPDWVISFLDIPTVLTAIAIRGTRVKFAPSKRSRMSLGLPQLSGGRFARWVYRRAERITCNSAVVQRELAAAFPAMSDRIRVIPNVIDQDPPKVELPEESRTEAERRVLQIACVGRLVEEKGPLVASRALAEASRSGLQVKVHWFGETGDCRLKRRIDDLLAAEGVAEMWVWRGVQDAMARRLALFDVLVHASSSESMSNAVLEAASGGCVLVLSDIEAHRDLRDMGFHAVLFEASDALSLAAALAEVTRRLGHHRKLARDSMSSLTANFSPAAVKTHLDDCFECATARDVEC